MGFRLQRRIEIAPGLRLNVSKRGLGVSVGPRGAKVSTGPSGRRASVGIPGTGMRYEVRRTSPAGRSGQAAGAGGQPPAGVAGSPPPGILRLGLLGKAFKPPYEKAFINGAQRLLRGDRAGALAHLEECLRLDPECSDARLLCCLIAMTAGEYATAQRHLETVLGDGRVEFPLVSRYLGPDMITYELAITRNVSAAMRLDLRSSYLALAEIYQVQGKAGMAVRTLQEAITAGCKDMLVKLSLVELYNDLERDDELIAVARGTENIDNVSLAVLFYMAQAMMRKEYWEAAVETLKRALSKKKDRDPELLLEARYVLGQVYEQSGKRAMARKQYERVFAVDSEFRDVRARIESLSK